MNEARSAWICMETLHAVTYFGEETQAATKDLGLPGFWSGYFGLRAAPFGPVGPGVVEASFFNFAPSFVERWIPGAWDWVGPPLLLAARSSAAAATLRRAVPGIDQIATEAIADLQAAVDAAPTAGRPLFAANRRLTPSQDPVERLWELCTCLREHRGDGHVAALTAAGIDGLEAHVLFALEHGTDPVDLQRTRGWTPEDWFAAGRRLQARGLIAVDGMLSEAGVELRRDVEATTDHLAAYPWTLADDDARLTRVIDLLAPAAQLVSAAEIIRYPNPMGLPPAHTTG